jgi:hypothetical protein
VYLCAIKKPQYREGEGSSMGCGAMGGGYIHTYVQLSLSIKGLKPLVTVTKKLVGEF